MSDPLRGHLVKKTIDKSVVLAVQLQSRDAQLELLQHAHVRTATK